jgi:type IV secretory pathway VirB10-like protein
VRYEIRAVLSMVAVVSLLSACKQSSREETEPAPATTPVATAVPSPTVAPPTPPPGESINIPPPVQPTVPAPAPAGSAAPKKAAPESVKGCCAALRKESETAADKSLYNTAATTCDAIDKLVGAGTTKKAAALTQLRASLKGGKLPAGCE